MTSTSARERGACWRSVASRLPFCHERLLSCDRRTEGREARRGVVGPRKAGFHGTQGSREPPPSPLLRSSMWGGKEREERGRTPCLPVCLPDWVPVTVCDHKSVRVVLAACIRSTARPALPDRFRERVACPKSAVAGWGRRRAKGSLPPLPCRSRPATRGVYRGGGPTLPSGVE